MHRSVAVAIGLLSFVGFAGTASAADLAARPYTKAPPMPEAVYNWTGFYIGVNGGGGWGHAREVDTINGSTTAHDTSGGLAGGQLGYNWQTGAWVFGVEADGDWADLTGSAPCPNPAFACASDTRALASFRGRIGWATGPALFYATGGLGYANERYTGLTVAGGTPGAGTTGVFTDDRWGYAVGAGIEWGFAPNWSGKIEYMHYGFDATNSIAGTLSAAPIALSSRIDTVKVGINYRFNGPVVARY